MNVCTKCRVKFSHGACPKCRTSSYVNTYSTYDPPYYSLIESSPHQYDSTPNSYDDGACRDRGNDYSSSNDSGSYDSGSYDSGCSSD